MFRPEVKVDRLAEIMERLDALEKEMSGNHEESNKRTELARRDCAYCDGAGKRPGPLGMASSVPCGVCKGRGYNLIPEDWIQCRDCGGTGKEMNVVGIAAIERKCKGCRGLGWVDG